MFVPVKPLQLSLMFVGKARSLHQGEAPERCFTQVGFGITHQHQTRLARPEVYLSEERSGAQI